MKKLTERAVKSAQPKAKDYIFGYEDGFYVGHHLPLPVTTFGTAT